MFSPPREPRKVGEAVNIAELQRRSDLAQKLRATLENQKLILETMALANQSLWHYSELEGRWRDVEREVALEVIKTARQWLDLYYATDRTEKRREGSDQDGAPDDLPF